MIKIMFVCHGNICRSPMAEFIFKDLVKKKGVEDKFFITSSATSTEEIGNTVYPPARKKLKEHNISCEGKKSIQFESKDYEKYDYIIAMEQFNIKNILRIIKEDHKNKVFKLLDFTKNPRDIDDPWYTGNFDITYKEIYEGCSELLDYVINKRLS
ncbi:low molecular weight protein-tyrosine-phosphatase [Clostridium sp. C2-6-12]|uniref:low molecular weight protein-tyrosine-phosphatase n=1 Tax=Clostridium sp. C2-6-12 TaxID=2698832 RepID=UPI00136B6099|nr:low molecular weight protein-tyrosine-phosphatase [Clostridium sp. C2-6-12]